MKIFRGIWVLVFVYLAAISNVEGEFTRALMLLGIGSLPLTGIAKEFAKGLVEIN